jgi:hypothetical protein
MSYAHPARGPSGADNCQLSENPRSGPIVQCVPICRKRRVGPNARERGDPEIRIRQRGPCCKTGTWRARRRAARAYQPGSWSLIIRQILKASRRGTLGTSAACQGVRPAVVIEHTAKPGAALGLARGYEHMLA